MHGFDNQSLIRSRITDPLFGILSGSISRRDLIILILIFNFIIVIFLRGRSSVKPLEYVRS